MGDNGPHTIFPVFGNRQITRDYLVVQGRSLLILFAFALVGSASLAQTADLAVDKSVDQSEIDVSDEATFYIAVTNAGPDAADRRGCRSSP